MSTNITPAIHFPKSVEGKQPLFSFRSLTETLGALHAAPTFADLNDWLSRVQVTLMR